MYLVKLLSSAILVLLLTTAVHAQAAQNTVTFTDNSNGETGFDLFRCTGAACPPTLKLVTIPASAVAAPATVTYIDNTVTEGNVYCYKVDATNGPVTSGFSNTACNSAPIPLNSPSNLVVK